jgi:hypothetical protein
MMPIIKHHDRTFILFCQASSGILGDRENDEFEMAGTGLVPRWPNAAPKV